MTFEATETRAPVSAAEEVRQASQGRQVKHPPRWDNKVADEMLEYVEKGTIIADQLRGLSVLFLNSFSEANGAKIPADLVPAVDIVADCMESLAKRLDLNAEHARARRDHLAAGGAR